MKFYLPGLWFPSYNPLKVSLTLKSGTSHLARCSAGDWDGGVVSATIKLPPLPLLEVAPY